MKLWTVCLCFFAVNINHFSFLVKSDTLECSDSRWHVCCGWVLVVTEKGCIAVVECFPKVFFKPDCSGQWEMENCCDEYKLGKGVVSGCDKPMTSPVPSESCRTSSPARKVAPLPEPAAPQSIPQIVPAAPDSAPWFKWKLLPDLSSTTAPELALGPSPPPPAECPARKRRRRSAQLDENTGSDLFGKETSDEDIIGGDPFVGIPVAQAGQEVEPHYAILNGCSQST